MIIKDFYDPATFTLTYVISDENTRDAVVVDPVLDYDPASGSTSTASVEQVSRYLRENGLTLHYSLETHAHADHLSGSQWLKKHHGAKVAIGARITEVQATFKPFFDLGPDFATDGSQFDRLLTDGEVVEAGSLRVTTVATPGHTPACVSFLIGDALFSGDALFIEDYGVGRCDFPKGSAEALYDSVVGKIYTLPANTRVFVGHDYQPGGRPVRAETTVGVSRRENVQLRDGSTKEEFVRMRKARDATLAAPRLLLPSVQVNIAAGKLPSVRENGKRYLHTPVNAFRPTDDVGDPLPKAEAPAAATSNSAAAASAA